MDTNTELFCKRLKAEIERTGMSFTELQNKTGIARSTICRYSLNQTKSIPIDNVKKLAKALGVSAEYLLGWEGDGILPATEEQLLVALFGGADEVTAEMWEEVREFAEFVKTKYNKP